MTTARTSRWTDLFPHGTALIAAALAMVATLPGRTHGLGLVTEPLLADLPLDRVSYAVMNWWATLLGAAFCVPCGWLLDRVAVRGVLLGITLGLAGAVLAVCLVTPAWGVWLIPGLFTLILLLRGLGQSALSVASLALMGRSLGPRRNLSVGIYSALVALGFMAAFASVRQIVALYDPNWRVLWGGIGAGVAGIGLAIFLILNVHPRQLAEENPSCPAMAPSGLTLGQSLRTPAFWVFAGATSLYGLVAAGVSLFNQSILEERGFDRGVFLSITTLSPLIGLAANLATGWLAKYAEYRRLLAAAMLLLTAALLGFPLVRSLWQVYLYALVMGAAGGMVTVIFFGVWRQAFGLAHLGKVQGAAQTLTVLASAVGPVILAAGQRQHGSYVPVFQGVALAAGLFAVAAWCVPSPGQATALSQSEEATDGRDRPLGRPLGTPAA